MGMLYEYEGFENLFESGEIVTIDAEYERPSRNGHMVRIKWYPEAIDNSSQIKIVDADNIECTYIDIPHAFFTGSIKQRSKIKLRVEYVAYHREDYHIIQIVSPESGIDDMLVHRSLFDIPNEIEPTVPFLEQITGHTKVMNDAAKWLINKLAG